MTTPHPIRNLASIADRYDALFCDAWGVIHNGVTLFPGVEEALSRFRAARGPVVILTNAPRPSSIIPPQLDRIGLSRDAYDVVITSGDATRAAIASFLPMKAYRLGPDKDDALYDGLDVGVALIEGAGFIVCTGLVDDASETPEDYREFLQRAAARGLPMICANPDIVVRWGDRLIYCAGALARLYEELGGDVIYGGKPHAPIYQLAYEKLQTLAAAPIDRRRILVIGDGVGTDIAGANQQRLDALFVAGAAGVHEGGADEASIARALDHAGVHAEFMTTGLQW